MTATSRTPIAIPRGLRAVCVASWLAAAAGAQTPLTPTPALAEAVTEARVREVVSWLAADDRGGRDSPSPGLEAAAGFLEQRFQAAGLQQLVDGSWRHRYSLPGLRIDSTRLELEVRRRRGEQEVKVALEGDADVRLLRAGALTEAADQPARIAYVDDRDMAQLLRVGGGRRPIVLEVATDHPMWVDAAGERYELSRRLRGTGPVFLVRDGALPADARPGDDWLVSWRAPGVGAADVPLSNVVGVLEGQASPDEFVVVSAHYDHVGSGRPVDGDAIYNGADDNASGTTAVVLLAEALAALPRPRRSVVFVCFSAEEKGLRGSRAFVEDEVVPPGAIVANVNLEMLGRPPEEGPRHAWITGREYSDFAAIAAPALARAGIELVEFGMARQLFGASDNMSFVRAGVVAHSISAGSLHADYHRPSDEVDKLDVPHMTAVIRGIGEVVLELANRDGRPAYNEQGRSIVERLGGR